MQEEMFDELWKNGQEMFRRWKMEGEPVPSHGRTRHIVREALLAMPVPEHVHLGGVMRFPADRVIRAEEIPVTIIASTVLLGTTMETDVKEEHALLGHLRRFIEAYTEPVTLFFYMPPLPMPGDGWRGWGMRYVARQGHGWKLAPEGV